MDEQRFGTKPVVHVDGERLSEGNDDQIRSVVVDHDLTSPGSCEVTIGDPGRDLLTQTGITLGSAVTIQASAVESERQELIFEGVVYSLDVTFGSTGQAVVLVAYDGSFALTQHRVSQAFTDVTFEDVFQELASEVGITVGSVEVEAVVFPQLSIVDETVWDFARRHASASGCVVRCHDDEVDIVAPSSASSGPEVGNHQSTGMLQLVPGHNVMELRVHLTSARSTESVEVRGWDALNKQPIIATSAATGSSVETEWTVADTAGELGARQLVSPRPDLTTQVRCDHHAEALSSSYAAKLVVANGEALGNPVLMAGSVVSLGGIDTLSGKFLLTQTRHRFDEDGYVTEFRCSGDQDRSLSGLLARPPTRVFGGVYPALVTDCADPEELGRVRVSLPWLSEGFESGWARVSQLGAGPERGLVWFPEIQDEVVVAFISGDLELPVVLGGLFSAVDVSPFSDFVDASTGQILLRGMKTRAGHTILLTDTEGEESIKFQSADESLQIVLDQSARTIRVESDGDVAVQAGGDLALSSNGNVMIRSDGNASIEAAGNLDLTSNAQVTVKGSLINLN